MVPAYYFISLIYSVFIIWVLSQINKSHHSFSVNENGVTEDLSILIPFKNEERNLPRLLESLKNQLVENPNLKVILINDNSTDQSVAICEDFISNNSLENFQIIHSKQHSKKQALLEGLSYLKSDWLLQTDADCYFESGWVSSFNSLFNQPVMFISGPVINKGKGLLGIFMEIESWALIAITALGFHRKSPQMCNAANMCWNKKEISSMELELIYNSDIPSGDDQFLMNVFSRQNPDSLKYNWSKEALVIAEGPANFRHFISQRMRWASKWKYSESRMQWIFPAIIWLYHLTHILLSALVAFKFGWIYLLPALIIKALAEYILLQGAASKFDRGIPVFAFVLIQLIYSPYVVLFGLLSQFARPKWK